MPGNEVGDRVHNFFEHENLSHGQHHSQVIDSWPVLGNNLRDGNQGQVGPPLSSNPKNYDFQLSEIERGQGSQSLRVPHGLNYAQLRPEFSKHQSQNQLQNVNGYMHGHQLQPRRNDGNLLGVNAESDLHHPTSRVNSILHSRLGNGPEQYRKNSETSESPVNFDFLGGQQQMNGQQLNMLQLPRQQAEFSDMQLLQQQVILKQMQEYRKQQQIQQLEARQQNSLNQLSIAKRAAGSPINGTPVRDASSYPWSPELLAGNSSWLQRSASPHMQGTSNGLVFSPEQGQTLRTMESVSQQVDHSLYGVPIPGTRGNLTQFSQVQADKSAMQQMPVCSNSFPGNQFAALQNQFNMQDGALVSQQSLQAKSVSENAPVQGLTNEVMLENSLEMNGNQSGSTSQDLPGRQGLPNSLEMPQKKSQQVTSSQSLPTLDPTEERILFGTDTNIWEAFGSSTNSLLDGADSFSTFPSGQSGTWSALMQSVVAETASSDIGLQEEWSGLSFQTAEPSTGNDQPVALNNSGKQPTVWAESSLQAAPVLGSRALSVDTNKRLSGHQQPGPSVSQQKVMSDKFIHQASETSTWSDHIPSQKPYAEASQLFAGSIQSSDGDSNGKGMPNHWTCQQNLPSYSMGPQLCNKSDRWNYTESLSANNATLKIQENMNLLQHPHSNDLKQPVQEDFGHGGSKRENDSRSSPNVSKEILEGNREDSHVNSLSVMPVSGISKSNHEAGKHLPDNRYLDGWKHVDSSAKLSRDEDLGNYQPRLSRGLQVLDSSADKETVETREVEGRCDKENSGDSYRSNLLQHASNVGMRENVRSDASASRTLPDANQKLSGQVTRKTSGPRRFHYHPMGPLDMDAALPPEGIHFLQSRTLCQRASPGLKTLEQGYFGQSQFASNVPTNPVQREKGQLPELEGDRKLNEMPSRGNLKSYVHNMPAPFDRTVGIHDPNKPAQSSENMLDLLHKVDQSREHGNIAHFSNQSSEIPETESSDGSACQVQQNQSSSQGFGLQLGPPSQRLPTSNRATTSQSSSRVVDSLSSGQVSPDLGVTSHMWTATTDSHRPLPTYEASKDVLSNSKSGTLGQNQQNISPAITSNLFYSRNQLHNQHIVSESGQVRPNQSSNMMYDGYDSSFKQVDGSHDRHLTNQPAPESLPGSISGISTDKSVSTVEPSQLSTNQTHFGGLSQQNPIPDAVAVSLPSVMSGTSLKGEASTVLPNTWNNMSAQQHLLGGQSYKNPSNILESHFQSNVNSEMMSATQKLDNLDARAVWSSSSETGAFSVSSHGTVLGEKQPTKEIPWKQVSPERMNLSQRTTTALQGKEHLQHSCDASPSNSAPNQRDIEAFGRSLKPNSFVHPNYSLLHQLQGMKSIEVNPSNRGLERFRGLETGQEAQQAHKVGQQSCGYSSGARDASVRPSVIPGDSRGLSFSSEMNDNKLRASSQQSLGTVLPQDMHLFARNNFHIYSRADITAPVQVEQSQVSPQMAPSWFDQFGTFKSRQLSQMYDAQRNANVKATEHQLIVGTATDTLPAHMSVKYSSSALDTSVANNIHLAATPVSGESEHFSSHPLPPDVTDQSLVVVRPKKRKCATFEFISWQKEVNQGSQRCHDVSAAEIDWAQAANRLMDMVEDQFEMLEDGPPMLRPKRRLRLTTQLMQQLFRPPMASVLSADASSDYESSVYVVARLAMGDACSLAASSKVTMPGSIANVNLKSDKLETSERIGDQNFSKVLEDVIDRSKKLENDLLGLDKRTSILDLRVENLDQEKYSIINRFAKFHGRTQPDGAESSSSSDAMTSFQKPCLQRYVTAFPMPRNLPDRVQCLSL